MTSISTLETDYALVQSNLLSTIDPPPHAKAKAKHRAKERDAIAQSIQYASDLCREWKAEAKSAKPDATLSQVAATLFNPATKHGLDVQTTLSNHFRPAKPTGLVNVPKWQGDVLDEVDRYIVQRSLESGNTTEVVDIPVAARLKALRVYEELRLEHKISKAIPRVQSFREEYDVHTPVNPGHHEVTPLTVLLAADIPDWIDVLTTEKSGAVYVDRKAREFSYPRTVGDEMKDSLVTARHYTGVCSYFGSVPAREVPSKSQYCPVTLRSTNPITGIADGLYSEYPRQYRYSER